MLPGTAILNRRRRNGVLAESLFALSMEGHPGAESTAAASRLRANTILICHHATVRTLNVARLRPRGIA